MERSIYDQIKRALRKLGRRRQTRRHRYTDAGILEVYIWAALHDRPVSWACCAENWPRGTRRGPLPDASTVSRRMRSPQIIRLIERLRLAVRPREHRALVAIIDGKPLVVSPNSHDRQSGFGYGAGRMVKGYKMHVVIDTNAHVLDWRVTPMNTDERLMARRILAKLSHAGYVLGDCQYSANSIFKVAEERGMQLVAPRYPSQRGKALGHRKHTEGRRRSIQLLEGPNRAFARALMKQRWGIERYFGQLTSAPGSLAALPSWVRGWRRVRNWVAIKLTIHAARQAHTHSK